MKKIEEIREENLKSQDNKPVYGKWDFKDKIMKKKKKLNNKIIEELIESIYPFIMAKYMTKSGKMDRIRTQIKKALSRQREEIIDEMVAEIFIRKDGILPLRDIYLEPNEIKEIREKLKKRIPQS